ncbi:MAG: SDR family NAD(P)-dependent oxidoreductase [Candidatus Omnitrophica bacterium]|nr:SDR family NAD(P)-dependent oxidoreductase [Candidatus Omnitrophota bacterium]
MPARAVSILGCGWLGLPLAKHLLKLGYSVLGSTASPEKIPVLQSCGIRPFLLEAVPRLKGEKISAFFKSSLLFLNIPLECHLEDPSFYKEQIRSVVQHIREGTVEFVIFAGSTAVYPETLEDATEDTALRFPPGNPRAQVLWEVEQILLADPKFKTTVVRFGGLYGPGRPIGLFLAGKKGLSGGDKPVNLIHQQDCLRVVAEIIGHDVRGEIFNAVSDCHPTRKALYAAAAKRAGLEAPEFLSEGRRPYKIVRNDKLKKRLDFVFWHPDPLNFSESDE